MQFILALERKYGPPAMIFLSDEYAQRDIAAFNELAPMRIALLVVFIVTLVGLHAFCYRPLMLALHDEQDRIRSILLMFPEEVIDDMAKSNKHLKRQLQNVRANTRTRTRAAGNAV